jgi:hypothetical protein
VVLPVWSVTVGLIGINRIFPVSCIQPVDALIFDVLAPACASLLLPSFAHVHVGMQRFVGSLLSKAALIDIASVVNGSASALALCRPQPPRQLPASWLLGQHPVDCVPGHMTRSCWFQPEGKAVSVGSELAVGAP